MKENKESICREEEEDIQSMGGGGYKGTVNIQFSEGIDRVAAKKGLSGGGRVQRSL